MYQNILKWIDVFVYPFFILSLPFGVQSQITDFEAIYKTTLDLDFKKSASLLKQTPELEIPFGDLYIANLNNVLELIFSEEETRYNELKQNEGLRLDFLSDSEDDSPYKDFVKGAKQTKSFTRGSMPKSKGNIGRPRG